MGSTRQYIVPTIPIIQKLKYNLINIISRNNIMATTTEMSKEEINAFRKAFDHFDKNNDGTINIKELGDVMKSMGKDPSKEELQDMINNVDLDGNTVLDFKEFLAMMGNSVSDSDDSAELKHVFAIFDKKGDGYICKSELSTAMKKLNENFTDHEIEMLITEADLDLDERVNFKEFKTIMAKM